MNVYYERELQKYLAAQELFREQEKSISTLGLENLRKNKYKLVIKRVFDEGEKPWGIYASKKAVAPLYRTETMERVHEVYVKLRYTDELDIYFAKAFVSGE